MTALVVIIVVLTAAVVGLALLYRSQGVVVARQRKHNELLRRAYIATPERASEPSCVSCADLGLEGGCRVCGQ